MKFSNVLGAVAAVACLLSATNGYSHARWDPNGLLKPRQNASGQYPDDIKTGPCGNLPRSSNPVELEAGATITVDIEATIYHQGVFRISFSPANDSGFEQNVLIDNVPDIQGQGKRSLEITLPDTTCDACTLQLIQTMPDRNPPSNYFSCTDIKLVSSAAPAPNAPVNFAASQEGEDVHLAWSSSSPVVVLESTSNNFSAPQLGSNYSVGDNIGSATVVHVGESSTQLSGRNTTDTYYYAAYAYNEDFVYSAASTTQIQLQAIEEPSSGGSSGGAVDWYWFVLVTFASIFIRRRSSKILHA